MMARRCSRTVTFAALLLLVAGVASANLVMNFKQDGGDVLMTLKGSVTSESWETTNNYMCDSSNLDLFHFRFKHLTGTISDGAEKLCFVSRPLLQLSHVPTMLL